MNKVIEFLKDDWKRSDIKRMLLWSCIVSAVFMTGFILGDHIMNPPVYAMSDSQFQSFKEGLNVIIEDDNVEVVDMELLDGE